MQGCTVMVMEKGSQRLQPVAWQYLCTPETELWLAEKRIKAPPSRCRDSVRPYYLQ